MINKVKMVDKSVKLFILLTPFTAIFVPLYRIQIIIIHKKHKLPWQ